MLNFNNPQSTNALTFSATPAFNATSYNNFTMTLSGNVTSSTITGGTFGQGIFISLCQDSTGGRTVVWPTNLINAPVMASAASACTSLLAIYNGSNWLTASATSTATTATDQYMLQQPLCTISASTDAGCTGSITLTTAEPDTNYAPFLQVESPSGAWIYAVVTSRGTTTLGYAATCTYNCGTIGSPVLNLHIHHP